VGYMVARGWFLSKHYTGYARSEVCSNSLGTQANVGDADDELVWHRGDSLTPPGVLALQKALYNATPAILKLLNARANMGG